MKGAFFEAMLLAAVAIGSTALNEMEQAWFATGGMPQAIAWIAAGLVPAVLFVALLACEVRTWRAVVDVAGGSEAVDVTTKVVLGFGLWLVGGMPQAALAIADGLLTGAGTAELQVPILQVLVPFMLLLVVWFRLGADRR